MHRHAPLIGCCWGLQAEGAVRARLERLEREVDEQQGWVRGGTKAEVRSSACQPP